MAVIFIALALAPIFLVIIDEWAQLEHLSLASLLSLANVFSKAGLYLSGAPFLALPWLERPVWEKH